jgi:hypothetical protein
MARRVPDLFEGGEDTASRRDREVREESPEKAYRQLFESAALRSCQAGKMSARMGR